MEHTDLLIGYYTTSEAADYLGISTRQVSAYCVKGRLDAIRINRGWMIEEESLVDFKHTPRPRGNPSFKKSPRDPCNCSAGG